MNASNVLGIGNRVKQVAAAAALVIPPGEGNIELTGGSAVTITSINGSAITGSVSSNNGRIILLSVASGASVVTITHTNASSATIGKVTLSHQHDMNMQPGDQLLLQQDSVGAWAQVSLGEKRKVIKSTSGAGARTIAHGLGCTPTVAGVTVTTVAGAIGTGWTLGAVGGTSITFTVANSDDIVYLDLVY